MADDQVDLLSGYGNVGVVLHSDSEGIWTLPGMEGREVGSTSG